MQQICPALVTVTLVLSLVSSCWAVKPADQVLPDSTCLYVSFPDIETFRQRFSATEFGKLARDPVMKPFAEDLGRQLRTRFGETEIQLGLTWDDLAGVYAGEACLARIQPGGEPGQHATAMLIDVTGRDEKVGKVRDIVDTNMQKRKADKREEQISGVAVTIYQLPKEIGEVAAREVFLTIVDNQLLLVNHREELGNMIMRIQGNATEHPLADAKSFREIQRLVLKKSSASPDIRWFMDPFTYADVIHSSRSRRLRRGKDLRQKLQNQGFDAIRAFGGHIYVGTPQYEVLHHTVVYAPAVTPLDTKYNKAARMLDFPATSHLPTEPWIPRQLATFASFNWKIREAFEYAISLIDEYVDSPNFVEEVLEDFEKAKGGPMINIRTELLDYLGEHVITFSDYELPMTTKSERVIAAIAVRDEERVRQALRRLWQDGDDPTVRKRQHGELTIWEIVPEEDEELNLNLPVPAGGKLEKDRPGGPVPNAAMTVARGYLLVATHIDYLIAILEDREPFDSLQEAADFKYLNAQLDALGAGTDSFRFFSRKDEEYRSAYEMIRQGKMPESESMLGRLLNRFLGPEEEGVLRKPEVDGSKLPPYEVVRRHLGPGGSFVAPIADGWFITGVVISKQKLLDTAANDALTTTK